MERTTEEAVKVVERGGDHGLRFSHRLCGACEEALLEDLEYHNLQKRPVLTNHQEGGFVIWTKKVERSLLDEIVDEVAHAVVDCQAGHHA